MYDVATAHFPFRSYFMKIFYGYVLVLCQLTTRSVSSVAVDMPPKPRGKKATSAQNAALLKFIEKNEFLRLSKGTPEQIEEAWTALTENVNSIGGAIKSVEAWKKVYTEMKSHIRAKLRKGQTLNQVEEQCADIAGLRTVALGMPPVEELGFKNLIVQPIEQCEGSTVRSTSDTSEFYQNLTEDGNEVPHDDGWVDIAIIVEEPTDQQSAEPKEGHITEQTHTKNPTRKKNVPRKTPGRHRRSKTTPDQYYSYLQHKQRGESGNFIELCNNLNKLTTDCSYKNAEEWKQIFMQWEAKVKAKARRIYMCREGTGGGPPTDEFLTPLEELLLSLLSKFLIYGNPHVIELGFTKRKIAPITKISFKTPHYKIRNHAGLQSEQVTPFKLTSKGIQYSTRTLKYMFKEVVEALDNLTAGLNKLHDAIVNN